MMSVFSNNRFLKRVNPEIVRAKDDSGSSLNHPEIQKLMRQMVDMKYTIPILESGWGSSGYGDYVFFHNNHPDIYQFEEYKNISVNTTGNYVYVGRNYPPNGTFPHILYVEVPSNVGVTANDVASFETYLAANSIVIKRCIADNLKLWVHNGLVKTRTSGSDTFVPKAYDISGEENDAVQATEANQPKLVSDGMEFDEGSDFLNIGFLFHNELGGSAAISLSVWALTYVLAGQNRNILGSRISSTLTSNQLRFNSGGTMRVHSRSSINDSLISLDTTETYNTDQWYYFVVVWDFTNKTIKLYVNTNKDIDASSIGYSSDTYTPSQADLQDRIGNTPVSEINGMNGCINDFRIYNKALSASEISAIYNQTKSEYGHT